MPKTGVENAADAVLARELAKLWPHREHESNSMKALCCACGVHRWRKLYLDELLPGREVRYCFWCSRVRVDGVSYSA
jgi:hypothetical protein